jgi:hypothetical protein
MQLNVYWEATVPLREIPAPNLVVFRGHNLGFGPGIVEVLPRLRHFDLLETISDQNGNIYFGAVASLVEFPK